MDYLRSDIKQYCLVANPQRYAGCVGGLGEPGVESHTS